MVENANTTDAIVPSPIGRVGGWVSRFEGLHGVPFYKAADVTAVTLQC